MRYELYSGKVLAAVAAAAAALHLYENTAQSSKAFAWGWFLWQMAPYGLVGFLSLRHARRPALVPAALAVLAIDLWTHYEVFIAPGSSSAALLIVWMPLWSLVVVVPLATLITVLVRRRRRAA